MDLVFLGDVGYASGKMQVRRSHASGAGLGMPSGTVGDDAQWRGVGGAD